MKITEYPKATALNQNDVFILDGDNGTKGITADKLYSMLADTFMPVSQRKNTWGGRNLGSVVTDAQYDEIDAGTFRGLLIGDYWEINGVIWRIMDFDYWLGTGDVECTKHHVVIMPDKSIVSSYYNASNTTAGGYLGSTFSQNASDGNVKVLNIVRNIFGESHCLLFREFLTNAVTNGLPSGGAWADVITVLPNEIMIYGCPILSPSSNGTVIPYVYTIDKTQLAAMRIEPNLIEPHRENYWLRDVVSASSFAGVAYEGYAGNFDASRVLGLRPVFGIVKRAS